MDGSDTHAWSKMRLERALRQVGAKGWAFWHSEPRYLARILHPDERIGGLVYGYQGLDFVFLVATDRRVIFLDTKPLVTIQDDIRYEVVSGVSYEHAGIAAMVTLYTHIKDYPVQVFNFECSDNFVRYIDQRCLEQRSRPSVAALQSTDTTELDQDADN